MSHKGYRGVDHQLKYDLESDEYTVFCKTYTSGSSEVFLVINSARPTLALTKARFSIPFDGIPAFARSSCLKNFQQSGRGLLIVYQNKKSSQKTQKWKVAVVNTIWYNQGRVESY
jgi:hypothetical protein